MSELYILQVPFVFGNVQDTIYPVVLRDDRNMVLVDCGYSGFLPNIEQAMAEQGLDPAELTAIVITHADHDHMGALAAFQRKYPRISTIAGKHEVQGITGEEENFRLRQARALQSTLPPEQQEFGKAFCSLLEQVEPAKVDLPVWEGDTFDWCGGCTVLATPGHTPGHISLYLPEHDTLIAGDAAVLQDGQFILANPQFAFDLPAAEDSLQRLLHHPAKTVICYHGGARYSH